LTFETTHFSDYVWTVLLDWWQGANINVSVFHHCQSRDQFHPLELNWVFKPKDNENIDEIGRNELTRFKNYKDIKKSDIITIKIYDDNNFVDVHPVVESVETTNTVFKGWPFEAQFTIKHKSCTNGSDSNETPMLHYHIKTTHKDGQITGEPHHFHSSFLDSKNIPFERDHDFDDRNKVPGHAGTSEHQQGTSAIQKIKDSRNIDELENLLKTINFPPKWITEKAVLLDGRGYTKDTVKLMKEKRIEEYFELPGHQDSIRRYIEQMNPRNVTVQNQNLVNSEGDSANMVVGCSGSAEQNRYSK